MSTTALSTTYAVPLNMQTPPRLGTSSSRRYTEEEKRQLLANLDLEVEHRTRQFEATLSSILENFRNHHEGQVLRVPKLVRNITMAEFGDKYHGDINECLRGLQKQRHGEPFVGEPIDRKRKWTNGSESGPSDAESSRAVKNARLIQSPVKPSSTQKQRIRKTPASVRIARLPDSTTRSRLKSKFPSSQPHYASPTKASTNAAASSSSRPPSTDLFNPRLPKTPAYPRAPRKNERLMSMNGSPLANPFQLDMGMFGDDVIPEEDENDYDGEEGERAKEQPHRTLKRMPSIVIRRDPSFAPTQSQSQSDTSRRPQSQTRSRPASQASHTSSQSHTSRQVSALMRIPTKDGLLLEFDPLMTTPAELDALEGISESAKKQAKEDMTRLVQMALAKWKI